MSYDFSLKQHKSNQKFSFIGFKKNKFEKAKSDLNHPQDICNLSSFNIPKKLFKNKGILEQTKNLKMNDFCPKIINRSLLSKKIKQINFPSFEKLRSTEKLNLITKSIAKHHDKISTNAKKKLITSSDSLNASLCNQNSIPIPFFLKRSSEKFKKHFNTRKLDAFNTDSSEIHHSIKDFSSAIQINELKSKNSELIKEVREIKQLYNEQLKSNVVFKRKIPIPI